MSQTDRDRLVALKKAKAKKMTQRQAAEELKLSERHVRRMLTKMVAEGDKAMIHGLRGRASNRSIDEDRKRSAIGILKQNVYRGFGPTLASEYLAKKHELVISKETVRQWMREAGLRARRRIGGRTWCRGGCQMRLALGAGLGTRIEQTLPTVSQADQ